MSSSADAMPDPVSRHQPRFPPYDPSHPIPSHPIPSHPIPKKCLLSPFLALVATLLSPIQSSLAEGRSAVVATRTLPPPPGTTSAQPLPSADIFGDSLQQLGTTVYREAFAGVVINGQRTVTVYLASSNPDILTRIARLDPTQVPYRVVYVPHNYDYILSLTDRISADNRQALSGSGIPLGTIAPDVTTGGVTLTLLTPTDNSMAFLQRTEPAEVVTTANYLSIARAHLVATYGPDVHVNPQAEDASRLFGRSSDVFPFWGGDTLYQSVTGTQCSGGFPIKGNTTGLGYMITAGHCGEFYGWYADEAMSTFMGYVPPFGQYLKNQYSDDFEGIQTAVQGYVYGGPAGSSTAYNILGSTLPAIGAPITWDGATTGEVRNQTLEDDNLCEVFDLPGQGQVQVCSLIQSSNAQSIAQPGDSGGPIFQHTAEGANYDTYAIATIVGGSFYNGIPVSAFAEEIGPELQHSNATLLTFGAQAPGG